MPSSWQPNIWIMAARGWAEESLSASASLAAWCGSTHAGAIARSMTGRTCGGGGAAGAANGRGLVAVALPRLVAEQVYLGGGAAVDAGRDQRRLAATGARGGACGSARGAGGAQAVAQLPVEPAGHIKNWQDGRARASAQVRA